MRGADGPAPDRPLLPTNRSDHNRASYEAANGANSQHRHVLYYIGGISLAYITAEGAEFISLADTNANANRR